jgi:N-acetylmuramoyl-L-alanine amidase
MLLTRKSPRGPVRVLETRVPHRFVPSPNLELRKDSLTPTILLLHYTGMASADKACDWLCREESRVSCHYLVDELGNW